MLINIFIFKSKLICKVTQKIIFFLLKEMTDVLKIDRGCFKWYPIRDLNPVRKKQKSNYNSIICQRVFQKTMMCIFSIFMCMYKYIKLQSKCCISCICFWQEISHPFKSFASEWWKRRTLCLHNKLSEFYIEL